MPRRSQAETQEQTNGASEPVQAPVAVAPLPAPLPAPVVAVGGVMPPRPAPPVPTAAPHSQRAQQAESGDRDERVRQRKADLRALPKGVPITDVTVIIGMKTKQGRQEVIHDIGPDFRITKADHSVEEKVRATTEQGVFIGMEPTGEYLMTLKVKYYSEP